MAKRNSPTGSQNPFHKLKANQAIYPVLIGLGVVFYLFFREFDPDALGVIRFNNWSWLWILIALLLMIFRDLGYMIRLRILTSKKINWLQTFRVIMLWEFTSAITPSAIGGTSVAIIYVNKEGISVGRSSAVVLATSFLDELYFIIAFPLLLLIVKAGVLFGITGAEGEISFSNELFLFATIGYGLKFLYVIVISYGLFVNPRGLKWLILMVFKLPFLRKWRQSANNAGNEIVESSKEFRQMPIMFWLKAFGATVLSWTSRYWVANALLMAFFATSNHFLIFARQLVMWIMMLVSPTPGGSGFAEFVFSRYLGEFIPVQPVLLGSVAIAMALIWRIVTYYPYLFIGAIVFPRWIKRNFIK